MMCNYIDEGSWYVEYNPNHCNYNAISSNIKTPTCKNHIYASPTRENHEKKYDIKPIYINNKLLTTPKPTLTFNSPIILSPSSSTANSGEKLVQIVSSRTKSISNRKRRKDSLPLTSIPTSTDIVSSVVDKAEEQNQSEIVVPGNKCIALGIDNILSKGIID